MSGNLSILVVDDYPAIGKIPGRNPELRGFEVKTANSAAEALDIVEDHPVDILLTDVMMPDMNGVELYRETKKINPGGWFHLFNDSLCSRRFDPNKGKKKGSQQLWTSQWISNSCWRCLERLKGVSQIS